MPKLTDKKATQLFSLIWVLESLIVLLYFLSPSEPENRAIWLYSRSRSAIILFTGLLCGGSLGLFFATRKEENKLHELAKKTGWKEALAFGGIFLFVLSRTTHNGLLLLSENKDFHSLAGYFPYAKIFSIYFAVLGACIFVWVLYTNRVSFLANIQKERRSASVVIGIWFLLGILLLFADQVQRNFDPGHNWGLGGPHFPLLEWQIFLAWALATIFILREGKLTLSDKWIAVIIWGVTLALWLSQPVNPGYGAQAPIAPNYEIYPFSDAQLYDQNAQSIIIGKGMAGEEFPARPIYIIFLAVAHALVGQDYNAVVAFQTIFLAAFPAILYLLGKEISGRPLGIALATLAILRDLLSNEVAHFTVNVTYSKLLLSELPVALLLALFLLLAYQWIKKYPENKILPILTGGILGIAIFIRTQSIVALIPTFFLAAFHQKWHLRRLVQQGVLVIVGIALVITPWLYRNWQHTGGIVLDNPLSQMNVLAVRYSNHNEMVIPQIPGENDSEYSNRMLKIALESMRESPQWISNNVFSHFSQSFFGGFLVFPVRDSLPDFESLLIPTTNFWENWRVTSEKSPAIFLYMLLFAIGVVSAWKKERWLGLLPLGTNLFYNLWTALFFAGGIRFSFPVDWVYYLYQMLGLIVITRFIFRALSTIKKNKTAPVAPTTQLSHRWAYITAIIVTFVAGISLPLSEIVVPDQYPDKTQNQLWEDFQSAISADLNKNLILIEGRALYPRYFATGEGIAWTAKPGYQPSPESRLVFEMAGQTTGRVIFPLKEEPHFFPNAVDVTLLTEDGSLRNVQYILVSDKNTTILYERSNE